VRREIKWGAIVGAVSLVLLIGMSLITVSSLERVERTVRTPAEGEARTNPLLAAELFLTRMNVPCASTESLDDLPPTDHTILLSMENRVLSRARVDRLLDWVEAGGLLIVGPHLDDGEPTAETWNDVLLDTLGVFVEQYETGPSQQRREIYEVSPPDETETSDVRFFSGFGLTVYEGDPEDYGGYAIVWTDLGLGRAIVLNDLRFVLNDEIGDLDHAEFLWRLVRDSSTPRDVLLVHGWERRSIWRMLLSRAWPAAIASLLLVGVWLWRRGTRLGPVMEEAPAGSRSLIEHVDAIGYFLWRSHRADVLVDSARDALLRRLRARRPLLAAMSRERQVATLADASGLDPSQVDAAIFAPPPGKRERFTRTIRTLERLRREL